MMSNKGTEADRARSACHAEVQETWQGMSLQQLRSLTDEKLVHRYDVLMDRENGIGILGPDEYLAELNRRAADRQTTWLVRLTWVIAALTVALVAIELVPRIIGADH